MNHGRVLRAAPAVGVLLEVGVQAAVSLRAGEDVRKTLALDRGLVVPTDHHSDASAAADVDAR